MTDWPDIAAAYDVVAEHYAASFADEDDRKPFDRDLLDSSAAAMAGRGEVWDMGCGAAGHLTRYLADRGVTVTGIDISPASVDVARRRQPELKFEIADMRELPAGDRALAGLVAFYSVIHLPREQIPAALAEFRRVLAPAGVLLMAMHGGTGEDSDDNAFGHPVSCRATLVSLTELTELAEAAGFAIVRQHARPPYPAEYPSERLYVWAEAT